MASSSEDMMAEEDIDVEGDFDFSGLDTSSLYDVNEPPSKSAHLLPEFNHHPWMLEQEWSLDHCTDQKSKAEIEKMLLEEQQYIDGKLTVTSLPEAHCSTKVLQRSISEPPPKIKRKKEGNHLFKQSHDKYKKDERTDKKIEDRIKKKKFAAVTKMHNYIPVGKSSTPNTKVNQRKQKKQTLNERSPSSKKQEIQPRKKINIAETDMNDLVHMRQATDSEEETEIKVDTDGEEDIVNDYDGVYLTLVQSAGIQLPIHQNKQNIFEQHQNKAKQDQNKTKGDHNLTHEITDYKIGNEDTFNKLENEHDKSEVTPVKSSMDMLKKDIFLESEKEPGKYLTTPQAALETSSNSHITNLELYRNENEMKEEKISEHPRTDEYPIYTSSGIVMYMPNPVAEVDLDRDIISQQEQYIHSEFFEDRPGLKTPDRYLRIRNYIIDAWKQIKPDYLNKTCVRPGLRNCGDVNAIGRIHSYLEQIGAINFGCVQVQYHRPHIPVLKGKIKNEKVVQAEKMESMRLRERRTKVNTADEAEIINIKPSREEKKTNTQIAPRSKISYDPFKLLMCQKFSAEKLAPFIVTIEWSARVVMDIHSHLSKTEVIGMLGGNYSDGKLIVSTAQPCLSLSTSMQCEMDPVSQTQAFESIIKSGQNVVGWYHSHPTFPPNPSIRDLENQCKYQEWFAQGGRPFLGMIVSPYDRQHLHLQSQLKCLIVIDEEAQQGVPYEFEFGCKCGAWDSDQVQSQIHGLLQQYQSHTNRVNLTLPFNATMTCLDKMMSSISKYIPDESEEPEEPGRSLRKSIEALCLEKYTITNLDNVPSAHSNSHMETDFLNTQNQ